MHSLRFLLDELRARAALTWPERATSPAPAVRQIALVGDKEVLATLPPTRALGPRELLAARALLNDRRTEPTDVDPEPIDVEVLLALPPKEAFQLRQLLAVRPMLARGSEAAWLRVDQAILARHGIEAASVVMSRPGSALFLRDASLVPSMMAATRGGERARDAGYAWLLRHADLAAAYAVRAALGTRDREGGASLLAYLFHHGRAEVVEAALTRLNAPELRPLLERPYVAGLSYVPASAACPAELRAKLPFAADDVALLVASLLAPTGVGENALIDALRSDVEPRALGDFALALLDAWRASRTHAGWLTCAAELGDGRMPSALARAHRALLVKKDAGAFAVLDEGLAHCPSELALFELGRIAEGESAPARTRARALLQPHADAARMTVDRLIEHMMPSLDLDPRGERPIEGAEGFSLVVTATLAVVVRDPSGGLLASLPGGKAMAIQKSAVRELEAEVRALVTRTKKRLERAMCDGQALDLGWMTKLLAHPVLLRLAQSLVWQEGNARFRIAEDGTAATLDDEARPLPSGPIQVAHPASMNAEERARWRALFESYALVAPFAQLDRVVRVLTPAQESEHTLRSSFFATRVYTFIERGFRFDWGGDELVHTLPNGHVLHVALHPPFDPRTNAREQGELEAIASVSRQDERITLGALDPAHASELLELMRVH